MQQPWSPRSLVLRPLGPVPSLGPMVEYFEPTGKVKSTDKNFVEATYLKARRGTHDATEDDLKPI